MAKKKFIVFTTVILAVILIAGCTGGPTGGFISLIKPELSIIGLQTETSWGISKGCYGMIYGTVINSGNVEAYNTIIRCSTTSDTRDYVIGRVAPNNGRRFSFQIDISCFRDEPLNCYAICDNC